MVAHATLLWGSRRRMGTAEDLRSRGARVSKRSGGASRHKRHPTRVKREATGLEEIDR